MKLSIGKSRRKMRFLWSDYSDLAGDVYVREFNNLTLYEESKWMDLKDINDEIPEGFGVKIDRR